jgi:O-antigen ligase
MTMKIRDTLSWSYVFLASSMLAIGRVYDERLEVLGFNISLFLSISYLALTLFILISIKKIVFTKSKYFLYGFYLLIILLSPLLWMVYGFPELIGIAPGIEKYISFVFIVIPISFILIEKANLTDIKRLFFVLFILTVALSVLAIFDLAVTENVNGRLSVLGGGPIVFARWLGFGIIYLIVFPIHLKWFRIPLILIFMALILATGSRGPVLSLLITLIIYLALNFHKLFFKLILVSLLFLGLIFTTNVSDKLSELGNVNRIFMNFSSRGVKKKSTSARVVFNQRSLELLKEFPLGVGPGNWKEMVNKQKPYHLIRHEYPHNILLEIATEYGVLSALIFILILIDTLYLGVRKISNVNTNLYTLFFYIFVFYLINSFVSGMIVDARILFVVSGMIIRNKELTCKHE